LPKKEAPPKPAQQGSLASPFSTRCKRPLTQSPPLSNTSTITPKSTYKLSSPHTTSPSHKNPGCTSDNSIAANWPFSIRSLLHSPRPGCVLLLACLSCYSSLCCSSSEGKPCNNDTSTHPPHQLVSNASRAPGAHNDKQTVAPYIHWQKPASQCASYRVTSPTFGLSSNDANPLVPHSQPT
jgi:hypothetical protein